ncbi:MAG: hypothetical protein H6737_12045 [Alphaproteobacteria bacterium]|nr:hypothetical protein [Alphaproteobacteria bacterium]
MLVSLILSSALAASTPFDDCTSGVAPAAYVSAGCNAVCEDWGSFFRCSTDTTTGTSSTELFASSEWGGQDDFTAVWGTDEDKNKFCCQWDNSDPWQDWQFLGTVRGDHFEIGNGGNFEFCAPSGNHEVTVKTFDSADEVEMTCNGGTPPFADTTVVLGGGGDTLDARGWSTIASAETVIFGEGGADEILGASTTRNRIDGGAGADVIVGSTTGDVIFGGSGNDDIFGAEGDDIIQGGPGADDLAGEEGADIICAGSGDENDVLDGRDGGGNDADLLYAHAGGYSSSSGISGFSTSNDTCSVIFGGVSTTWAGASCDYQIIASEPQECTDFWF